jgi:hypothetical protein
VAVRVLGTFQKVGRRPFSLIVSDFALFEKSGEQLVQRGELLSIRAATPLRWHIRCNALLSVRSGRDALEKTSMDVGSKVTVTQQGRLCLAK